MWHTFLRAFWCSRAAYLAILALFFHAGCGNSESAPGGGAGGSRMPGGRGGTGATQATGGSGGAGATISAGGTSGSAGIDAGTGGAAGSGEAGSGGAAGTSGVAGSGGTAGTGGGTTDTGGAAGTGGARADGVWSPLSVLSIVNPMDHGAVGNGTADDLGALTNALAALPAAGGVVYLPAGKSFKKTNPLVVTKAHVKFWAPNRQAEIFQSVAGQRRHQSILCRGASGCGVFGVKLRSDAAARFDALEDNQISADRASLVEVVGCEIQGSAATGIMLYGSREHYIEGNYIHHTWADHVHHTNAAEQSWVWNNFIFNEDPSRGDDGVACVTYGTSSTRCSDMEWWNNTILHSGWGRGYSVIGGNSIHIHHNWAIGVAGAGVIVASESSYDTSSSEGITIESNYVYQSGHSIGHPGILISGLYASAPPLNEIRLRNNVSVSNPNGAYRAEGAYTNLTNEGLSTSAASLPMPIPSAASVRIADTATLRTRDVSHVGATFRPGLYRIHVRPAPAGSGFQQRFEYVVNGDSTAVDAFVATRTAAGDYLSEQRTVGNAKYALVLTAAPVTLPSGLSSVPFRELRSGDRSGELGWLWQRLDSGNY